MQRNSSYEARDYGKLWTHKGNKFVIGTLHGTLVQITAQYNPKELSRSSSASWTPHPNTSSKQGPSKDTHTWMQYGSTEPRTLTFELLFDGYEEGISVAPLVEQLESLTQPINMSSKKASERRPQACVAVWGTQSLRCVVMSVATKLTMFDASGEPLRATCNVTLKEADVVAMMTADKDTGDFDSRQKQISGFVESHKTRRHWTDDKPVVDAWSKSQPAPVAKPAPAATPAPAVEQKTPPAQTQDSKTNVEAADAQDEQDDRDNDEASSATTTTGTPSQPFAGDDDLDSPRANSTPAAAAPPTGTPSQAFAGDNDLDSPRAQKPATKTTQPDGSVSGTPSKPFAGDDDLDSPRAPAHSKVPADDLE